MTHVTLPPITVTPDLPRPPVLPPTHIAKPLPWDGKVIVLDNLDGFFNRRDITSERNTMNVIFTIASAQRNVEQSYLAYLPNLRTDIDSEIVKAIETNTLPLLDKLKFEKSVMDSMIKQSNAELVSSYTVANAFFGRDPLARDIKKNAVDFVNTLQSRHNPNTPLNTYKKWTESITAAYKAKILSEKIRILTEKSNALISTIATAQAEEDARLAAEAELIRRSNTFRAQGSVAATQPLFIVSSGVIAVAEATATLLAAAIRSAILGITSAVVGSTSAVVVGVFSLLAFPSKLGNGELPERYTFSTPLSDLAPDLSSEALQAAAATGETVDLPVRISSKNAENGQSELFIVKTDGVTVPSKVKVVAATYDAEHNVYTATTADVPPRTLTWTPIVSPGNSSTTSPAEDPVPPLYTGATVTPINGRIDTFPGVADASFDDFILINPADTGFDPLYVMFRDRREDPGVVTGAGQPVSGIWLGAASQGEGAPIPSQIADQLRGREFKNWREFRGVVWMLAGNDKVLVKDFSPSNKYFVSEGLAPYAPPEEHVGQNGKFEIHHVIPLELGGELYNIDNMRIVTPKRHNEIHRELKLKNKEG